MRVLRLDLGGDRVDFHPYLSVVHGLDDGLHRALVEALRNLVCGEVKDAGGLVEAHGVMFDLTPETLALFDLPNIAAADVDPVVVASDLPEAGIDPVARRRRELERSRVDALERVTNAEAAYERARLAHEASTKAVADSFERDEDPGDVPLSAAARDRVESSLTAPREELDRLAGALAAADLAAGEARRQRELAERRRAEAEQQLELERNDRDEATRASAAALAVVEAAQQKVDPAARAALDVARDRLTAADEERAANYADPKRVEEIEGQQRELEAALLAIETVDPLPVQVALRLVEAEPEPEMVESPEGQRLADEWSRIEGALGGEATDDDSGVLVAEARLRLDNARRELADAEQAARLPVVDRDDLEALENAHERVLDAQDRAERTLAGGRAKGKLERARAEEQEILERMGFVTYADFRTGTSIVHVDRAAEHRLEVARQEMTDAETALAKLEAGVTAELDRAELLSQRSQVRAAAVILLGTDPGDDMEWALRHHRVAKRDGGERTRTLRQAIEAAGVEFGDEEVSEELLVDFARVWLDEQAQTTERRRELEARAAEVDAQLRSARGDDDTDRAHDDDEARLAVEEAEARAAAAEEADRELQQAKAALEAATVAEEAATTRLAQAEADLFDAEESERVSRAAELAATAAAAAALDAERVAADQLAALATRLTTAAAEEGRAALEAAVDDAATAMASAQAELDVATDALHAIETERAALDVAAAGDRDGEGGAEAGAESAEMGEAAADPGDALEWYLLARLAAQRSVSFAGSVPLVIDDALSGVTGPPLEHVLERLERMSNAVQVIVIADDEEIGDWARAAGDERCAAVTKTSVTG